MGSSSTLDLPGAKALAYFRSMTRSLRIAGSKEGVLYTFTFDEPLPIFIQADVNAFRAHGDMVETDENGKAIANPGGVPDKQTHLSYHRYAPRQAPSITAADVNGPQGSGGPGVQSQNPGSQTVVPASVPAPIQPKTTTRKSATAGEAAKDFAIDPEVKEFEAKRAQQLKDLKSKE